MVNSDQVFNLISLLTFQFWVYMMDMYFIRFHISSTYLTFSLIPVVNVGSIHEVFEVVKNMLAHSQIQGVFTGVNLVCSYTQPFPSHPSIVKFPSFWRIWGFGLIFTYGIYPFGKVDIRNADVHAFILDGWYMGFMTIMQPYQIGNLVCSDPLTAKAFQ